MEDQSPDPVAVRVHNSRTYYRYSFRGGFNLFIERERERERTERQRSRSSFVSPSRSHAIPIKREHPFEVSLRPEFRSTVRADPASSWSAGAFLDNSDQRRSCDHAKLRSLLWLAGYTHSSLAFLSSSSFSTAAPLGLLLIILLFIYFYFFFARIPDPPSSRNAIRSVDAGAHRVGCRPALLSRGPKDTAVIE